jgi:hypothetical protein
VPTLVQHMMMATTRRDQPPCKWQHITQMSWTNPPRSYAFDVSPDLSTQTFLNRRVFAYIDTTIPDGIALDERGNVYVTSGDGVLVYSLCEHC